MRITVTRFSWRANCPRASTKVTEPEPALWQAPDVISLHSPATNQKKMLKSWEAAGDYADAIACLDDMTTIHTDHNLTRVRARLMRDTSHRAMSDDVLRALEHATPLPGDRSRLLRMVWGAAANWPVHGGEDSFRAFLLERLDWVHPCGGVRESASADTPICLCPLTAYLQVILRQTPMEDWAAALADPDPDASPLSLAWAWARRSPWIGARTAGVAVLVTMGRHVHRLMADAPVRAERERLAAENQFTTKGTRAARRSK
ncbi:hypothetical protein GGX14DRAFT_656966 [Mycena pura]|uniref:Uncharacterized protein n=1 Tax=Mycena pura TaxID=153505 RepID=A0AAD6YLF5_9AGAR|nr:hypothetical protein GGX14DRAFT_656966 [Mycena pura]